MSIQPKVAFEILVADEAWLGLALLHREHPETESFSAKEIRARLRAEHASPQERPGIPVHIYLHNVANVRANSAGYRMFWKLSDETYRLFRPGDIAHPSRKGKTNPLRNELPQRYHYLLDWYERDYCKQPNSAREDEDPVLSIRGVGKETWSGTDADEYVRMLRSNWYREGDHGR
jgi:hypothetical protein